MPVRPTQTPEDRNTERAVQSSGSCGSAAGPGAGVDRIVEDSPSGQRITSQVPMNTKSPGDQVSAAAGYSFPFLPPA